MKTLCKDSRQHNVMLHYFYSVFRFYLQLKISILRGHTNSYVQPCMTCSLSRRSTDLIPGGGGGGGPYQNDGGARLEFSKTTLKGTRISFGRRGSIILLPLRGTNLKQHKAYSVILFFSSQYPYKERYNDNSNRGHYRFQRQCTYFDP